MVGVFRDVQLQSHLKEIYRVQTMFPHGSGSTSEVSSASAAPGIPAAPSTRKRSREEGDEVPDEDGRPLSRHKADHPSSSAIDIRTQASQHAQQHSERRGLGE